MTTNSNHRITSKVSAVLAGTVLAAILLAAIPGAAGATAGVCKGDWDHNHKVNMFDIYLVRQQFGKNGVGVQEVMSLLREIQSNFGAQC